MTDDLPDEVERTLEGHDAFERADGGYRVTTTAFDGVLTATEGAEWRTNYALTVRAPTLQAATTDDVGEAVLDGWFETLERRLEAAPKSTRTSVELDEFEVERDGEDVFVTYQFTMGDAGRAASVAKAFTEYVEGTYVEGVVPGYDYEGPVAELVDSAATGGSGEAGGTPL